LYQSHYVLIKLLDIKVYRGTLRENARSRFVPLCSRRCTSTWWLIGRANLNDCIDVTCSGLATRRTSDLGWGSSMTINTKSEPLDDEWHDEAVDVDTNDWTRPLRPADESRRLASRRAIEIAKEERALRMALDDFSENR
jgi:hypothetical protein